MTTVINEKTRFGWPILVSIVSVAVTAAGGLMKATEAADSTHSQSIELHRQELRLQRVEDNQTAATEALREIKTELRALNSHLTNLAGGSTRGDLARREYAK